MWRAEAESRLRDAPRTRLSHGQGDPEVGDEWLTLLAQKDVTGFDVAMDHAVPVRVVECACDLLRDRQCVVHTELLLTVDAFPE